MRRRVFIKKIFISAPKYLISRQMTKLAKIFFILCLALLPFGVAGQSPRYTISPINAESVLKTENIRSDVEYLCAESLGGRACGSEGSRKASVWISGQFSSMGMRMINGAWTHGFRASGGDFCRNVIGLVPGSASEPRYVIVMAHFDNLGVLNGSFYPGADSNASGVAALVEVARMFSHMKNIRRNYGAGLLVVALDGKEKDLAGARELWNQLEAGKLVDPVTGSAILPSAISLVVNLDQVGSTLSPITKGNPNYLIMLGEDGTSRRGVLESVNRTQHLGMELGFDYYGSKDFTKLFYRSISDQKVFIEHGVPSVMFTSGITFQNNKVTDTPETLDYDIMRKRIQLVFYYLDKIL